MTFGAPWLLAFVILVPAAAGLWVFGTARGRAAACKVSRDGRVTRAGATAVLLVVAGVLAAFAAGLPRWGERESFIPRTGAQVVFVVDVSPSMAVTDVAPNRLEAAKAAVARAIGRLGGDRVGLVVFGGDATLRFPLTTDLDAATRVVESLQVGPVFVERGTNLPTGLEAALNAFDFEGDSGRLLVLVSDGEDLGDDPADVSARVREAGIDVIVAGVGTAAGAPVPVFDSRAGAMATLRYPDGREVIARLDEGFLRAVAVASGGRYAGTNLQALPGLVSAHVASLQRARISEQATRVPVERFAWFAGAAAILATLACAAERLQAGSRRVTSAGLVLATALLMAGCATRGYELNEQGLAAFAAGDYWRAEELFIEAGVESPGDATPVLNLAAALHAQGRYEQAAAVARRVLQSRSADARARAYASIGHHRFAAGDLEGALAAFRGALIENPADDVSRRDYEVVLRLLGAGGGPEEPGNGTPGGGEPGSGEPGDGEPGSDEPGEAPGGQPGEQPGDPGGQPGEQPGDQGGQPGTGPGGSPQPATPRELEEALRAIDAELRALYEEAGDTLTVAEAIRILELTAERERLAGLRSTFQPVLRPEDR